MFLSIRQSLIHQLLGFNYRTLNILFGDKGILVTYLETNSDINKIHASCFYYLRKELHAKPCFKYKNNVINIFVDF